MSDTVKQYKKSILGHEFKIKELEIILERQNFYKEVVDQGKIRDTLRRISILKAEIKAFKKQIPRETIDNLLGDYTVAHYCQECSESVSKRGNYCRNCGQKIG